MLYLTHYTEEDRTWHDTSIYHRINLFFYQRSVAEDRSRWGHIKAMAARRGETLCDRGVRARWDVTLHVLLFSISVHWLWYINNLILFVRVHKNYLVRAPRLKAMTAHRWQRTWRDCCVTAGCELLLHVIRVAIICRNTLNCKLTIQALHLTFYPIHLI